MTPPQPLYIGNMVCDRCLTAVESTLRELGWTVTEVALGRVLAHPPPGGGDDDARQLSELDARLRRLGFELHDAKAGTIDRIKGLIIQYVYNDAADPNLTLSELLSGQLHREYSHLSRQFSAAEGRTVEDFYRAHRMELAKRLLSSGAMPPSTRWPSDCITPARRTFRACSAKLHGPDAHGFPETRPLPARIDRAGITKVNISLD